MSRLVAARVHGMALASVATAAAIAAWAWLEATKPIRWVGPLTEEAKR